MKVRLTSFLVLILTLALAAAAFAQPAIRDVYYVDDQQGTPEQPLRSLCSNGVPLPDGSASICLYWDNNNNGPDPSDVQPTQDSSGCYGCVNSSCFPMNGEAQGLGAGFFLLEPSLVLSVIPESPDVPNYYFRINVAYNGDTSCWTSTVFTMTPGWAEIWLSDSNWTCVTDPCQISGNVPNPPTNVQASEGTRCIGIDVTWLHDGQNVSGFGIYDQSGLIASAIGTQREAFVPIDDSAPHSIYVRATNAVGSSDSSSHDIGSTYLLHFADGPSGNLFGDELSGEEFTIAFQRPEISCPSRSTLMIINSNNQITDTLCVDSLVDEMTCLLPTGNQTNLRLLLVAYSFDRFITLTDTTDSTFSLGALGVGDRESLIPEEFALAQNFPNPFNPTTTIEFSVPYQSDVKIEVYNITGQLVKTLVDGSISAGVHYIAWDGISNSGISASSGLYFYRMSGPGFVQTRKMLMLK